MKKILILMTIGLFPFIAFANEDALYDAPPPADAAFVRIINANPSLTEVDADLSGSAYSKLAYPSASDYHIIMKGDKKLTYNDQSIELALEAGKYYTIALIETDNALSHVILNDELLESPSKARVYFYNLSAAQTANLVSPTHNANIFTDIAQNKAISREINAVELTLSVSTDSTEIKKMDKVTLKRQAGLSIILVGNDKKYDVILAQNKIKK